MILSWRHCWSHCCTRCVGEAFPPLQENHYLHQGGVAVKTRCKNICWHPGSSYWTLSSHWSSPNKLWHPDQISLSWLSPPDLVFHWDPWEDRLEEAFGRKFTSKKASLAFANEPDRRARFLPVEDRIRGFIAQWLFRTSSSMGIIGERKRKSISKTTEVAERAWRWLWLKTGETWGAEKPSIQLTFDLVLLSLYQSV